MTCNKPYSTHLVMLCQEYWAILSYTQGRIQSLWTPEEKILDHFYFGVPSSIRRNRDMNVEKMYIFLTDYRVNIVAVFFFFTYKIVSSRYATDPWLGSELLGQFPPPSNHWLWVNTLASLILDSTSSVVLGTDPWLFPSLKANSLPSSHNSSWLHWKYNNLLKI